MFNLVLEIQYKKLVRYSWCFELLQNIRNPIRNSHNVDDYGEYKEFAANQIQE